MPRLMELEGCDCLLEAVAVSIKGMESKFFFGSASVVCFVRLKIARWISGLFVIALLVGGVYIE